MMVVVFMVEEASMKEFLEAFVPRHFPDLTFRCIAHEGKNDLERSLPIKLRAWNEPEVCFVILRDNDGADCREVKERLWRLCQQAGRESQSLVRLVCQELEAWYVGDWLAVAEAFEQPSVRRLDRQRKWRQPDLLPKPSEELGRILPDFRKSAVARSMGAHLTPERNRSASFLAFVNGLEELLKRCASPLPHDSPGGT